MSSFKFVSIFKGFKGFSPSKDTKIANFSTQKDPKHETPKDTTSDHPKAPPSATKASERTTATADTKEVPAEHHPAPETHDSLSFTPTTSPLINATMLSLPCGKDVFVAPVPKPLRLSLPGDEDIFDSWWFTEDEDETEFDRKARRCSRRDRLERRARRGVARDEGVERSAAGGDGMGSAGGVTDREDGMEVY